MFYYYYYYKLYALLFLFLLTKIFEQSVKHTWLYEFVFLKWKCPKKQYFIINLIL